MQQTESEVTTYYGNWVPDLGYPLVILAVWKEKGMPTSEYHTIFTQLDDPVLHDCFLRTDKNDAPFDVGMSFLKQYTLDQAQISLETFIDQGTKDHPAWRIERPKLGLKEYEGGSLQALCIHAPAEKTIRTLVARSRCEALKGELERVVSLERYITRE